MDFILIKYSPKIQCKFNLPFQNTKVNSDYNYNGTCWCDYIHYEHNMLKIESKPSTLNASNQF
jgi:hypothetical protein